MEIEMNKTALITGASSGIGKAIAYRLAEAGYQLKLTCRQNKKGLDTVCREIEEIYDVQATGYVCDVSDSKRVKQLFEELEEVDVLVNNAGVAHISLLQDMTDEQWRCVIDTNLSGAFYMCRAAIPKMLKRGCGRILNISSVWGNVGASMEVAYSASKGGLNAMTKALAKELAPSNIAVHALSCGVIDTPMNDCFSAEEMKLLKEEIPADRIGTPMEVAQAAYALLQLPTYCTGQIVTIDGGWQ